MNVGNLCQREVVTLAPGTGLTSAARVAATMGGDDPAAAYAAAMLWYQGYPEVASR